MKQNINYDKAIWVFVGVVLLVLGLSTNKTMAATNSNNPLLTMNYHSMTDAEISDACMKATDYQVGQLLMQLTEIERNRLLLRDTILVQPCTTNTYRSNMGKKNKMEIPFDLFRQETVPYYERAMNCFYDTLAEQSSGEIIAEGIQLTDSHGEYRLNIYSNEELTWKSTVEIMGVDTSKDLSNQQTVYVKETFVGMLTGGSLYSDKGVMGQVAFSKSPKKNDDLYRDLALNIHFKKNKGYYVVVQKNDNSFYGDFMFLDSDGNEWTGNNNSSIAVSQELKSYVDLYYNTTLGPDNNLESGRNAVFDIYFKPCEYTVQYDGNGATQGATLPQKCIWLNDYYYAVNGFKRKYCVTFDGNGGDVSDARKVSEYDFVGWGDSAEASEEELYKEGSRFSSLTAEHRAKITKYANWEEKSITLPKAEKDGYLFLGWTKSLENVSKDTLMKGYSEYVPTCDETLYAVWGNADNNIDIQPDNIGDDKENEKEDVPEVSGNEIHEENDKPIDMKSEQQSDATGNNEQSKQTIRQKNKVVVYQLEKNGEITITNIVPDAKAKSVTVPNTLVVGEKQCPVTRLEASCFQNAKKLEKITFDCSNLQSVGKGAFRGLKKLKTVDLSKAKKLQYISDECFWGCSSLKKVILPKNIQKIGRKAFYQCKNLKNVQIKSSKLKYVGSKAFEKCHKSLKFVVPRGKKKAYQKLIN